MNREQWLERAVTLLASDFARIGHTLPSIRVSVGFPGGGSARKRIGEYWHTTATQDGVAQIFISPVLGEAVKHLDVLVHELCHAAVGPKCGHRGAFRKAALAIGLTGKMTATVAGTELLGRLNAVASEIGPFPHSAINLSDGRKKQSTRLIKVSCVDCEYIARVSQTTLDTLGAPICPGCNQSMKGES